MHGPAPVVHDGYVYEDYGTTVSEPMELDDGWIDVDRGQPTPPKDMVIIHALRDLQLSRYIYFVFVQ